jgi:hypothetical protein
VISLLLTVFLMAYTCYAKETPHFLFKTRKYEECLDHLKLMARWNNYTENDLPSIEQMKLARDRYVHIPNSNG